MVEYPNSQDVGDVVAEEEVFAILVSSIVATQTDEDEVLQYGRVALGSCNRQDARLA